VVRSTYGSVVIQDHHSIGLYPYLAPFLRYSDILIENCRFNLYMAPPLGVIPVEYHRDLQQQKLRVLRLSWGVVCVILCLAILVQRATLSLRAIVAGVDSRLRWLVWSAANCKQPSGPRVVPVVHRQI